MLNKKFLLLMMVILLFSFQVAFASEVSLEDNLIEDDVISVNEDITQSSIGGDILGDSAPVYFNASVDEDGNGSLESPFKYLYNYRVSYGDTLYFANGVYNLTSDISIYESTFVGEDVEKTIFNLNGYSFTIPQTSSLRLSSLTLNNASIMNTGGTLTAYNVIFDSGNAEYTDGYDGSFGGAINCNPTSYYGYSYYNPELNLNNCTFTNNTAVYGGAIYISSGVANIYNTKFEKNYAENFGGAIACVESILTVSGCIFEEDYSINNGGGAIYLTDSDLNLNNTHIINCTSTFGGAICDLNSSSKIVNLMAVNNTAIYDGGAIYKMYGDITISDSNFHENSANNGGALFIDDSDVFSVKYSNFVMNLANVCGGGIFSILNSRTVFTKNTYSRNVAMVDDDLHETNTNNLNIGSDNYTMFQYKSDFNGSLPSRYDLRELGFVTPIKDQQTSGNCWAFSGIAALESCILKASNISYDLSEENMKNLIEVYSSYGWNRPTNQGGFDEMAIGYLTSWLGPINESSNKFDDYSLISPIINSIMHVQNVVFLGRESYTDNDAIKRAIMEYGGVSTGIYYNDYYLSNRNGYYYPNDGYANHAVTIVGWDDDYSRLNFAITPRANGAWIVKNSWGESWGDSGFFYVSYYDAIFAKVGDPHGSYTFLLNDTVRFSKNYQYDISGLTDFFITGENNIWYKNVFNATDNELLAAFSTYFNSTTDWEAFIYVNNDLVFTQTGSSPAGYYTIDLKQFIPLCAGDTFTIALNITSDKFASFPISEKLSLSRTNYYENISFFSYDGKIWYDLYDYATEGYDHYYDSQVACIKAFTIVNSFIPVKISIDEVNTTFQTPTELIAHIIDDYGNPVSSGKFTFITDGGRYQTDVQNGTAKVEIFFNNLGSLLVEGYFESDSLYNDSYAVSIVNVEKSPVNLTVDVDDVYSLNDVIVNIGLFSFDNPLDAIVKLFVGDMAYDVTILEGKGSFVIPTKLKSGQYEAVVYYDGSNSFYNSTANHYFDVINKNIDMDVVVNVVDVKKVLVDFILSEKINGTLTALFNDSSYDINYTDGVGSLLIDDLDYGLYNVNVSFNKDGYDGNEFLDIVVLEPYGSVLITNNVTLYYKNGTRFEAKLVDAKGNPISNQSIEFILNNVKYDRVSKEDGTVSIGLNMDSGNYTIYTNYYGDEIYLPANATNHISILPSLYASDIVKYYRNNTQYLVLAIDYQGNPLSNETIIFNINGVMYNRTTNSEGIAKLNINLNPGNYIVSASNPITNEKISNNVTVLSRFEGNDLVKYYRNDSQYLIKLFNDQGEIMAGRTVKFNINGVFYYRVTNDQGIAKLNINLDPGDYIITAFYDSCSYSNNIKVLPVLFTEDLHMAYKDESKFEVKLLDGMGKVYSGQKIIFNINGVFYERTTDSDGIARLNINLMAGEYIITSSYNGSNIANTVTISS